MNRVYLSLGTNLGDKHNNLHLAVQELAKRVGGVVSLSAFYETAPWGFESENSFLNAAVSLDTLLNPFELLRVTQQIELDLGRIAKTGLSGYADRLIDIDILLYNDWRIESEELTIPHPLMEERDFVMTPLREIYPDIENEKSKL